MIEFLDPRAEPSTPIEPYELSVDVSAGPITLGLLANGFPDSVHFLAHVEKALARALPRAHFHHYNKGDASAVVTEPMLETIVAECRAVVAAYGH
jgi:hypothetical protein